MELTIGKIDKSEFFQTENLTRETFWNLYQSGCTKHLMIHNPFMALELQEDGLAEIQGKFFLDDSVEINEQELTKYEK